MANSTQLPEEYVKYIKYLAHRQGFKTQVSVLALFSMQDTCGLGPHVMTDRGSAVFRYTSVKIGVITTRTISIIV